MLSKREEIVETPLAYIVSLLATTIWLLMIITGPLLYKLPSNMYFIADFYYYLFHYTCHQQPSRCYWMFDYQLPVCVRCFGIYFGAFFALAIYPLFKNVKSNILPSKWWLLMCFVPIGIDGISSVVHLYASPHWLRLLTGAICGGVAMCFILPGFNEITKKVQEDIP